MPQITISCPLCNNEILVIPDVLAMTKAIESHVASHDNNRTTVKLKSDRDVARDGLLANLFDKILIVTTEKKEHKPLTLQGRLDKFAYEGFYVQDENDLVSFMGEGGSLIPNIAYINDHLKPFIGKRIKITVEEL